MCGACRFATLIALSKLRDEVSVDTKLALHSRSRARVTALFTSLFTLEERSLKLSKVVWPSGTNRMKQD